MDTVKIQVENFDNWFLILYLKSRIRGISKKINHLENLSATLDAVYYSVVEKQREINKELLSLENLRLTLQLWIFRLKNQEKWHEMLLENMQQYSKLEEQRIQMILNMINLAQQQSPLTIREFYNNILSNLDNAIKLNEERIQIVRELRNTARITQKLAHDILEQSKTNVSELRNLQQDPTNQFSNDVGEIADILENGQSYLTDISRSAAETEINLDEESPIMEHLKNKGKLYSELLKEVRTISEEELRNISPTNLTRPLTKINDSSPPTIDLSVVCPETTKQEILGKAQAVPLTPAQESNDKIIIIKERLTQIAKKMETQKEFEDTIVSRVKLAQASGNRADLQALKEEASRIVADRISLAVEYSHLNKELRSLSAEQSLDTKQGLYKNTQTKLHETIQQNSPKLKSTTITSDNNSDKAQDQDKAKPKPQQ